MAGVLRRIQWNAVDTSRFLGIFLSEPKPDVVFDPPAKGLSFAAFAKASAKCGVRLDRRTQWIYDDAAIYLNGEAKEWSTGSRMGLIDLANARNLSGRQVGSLSPAALRFLHDGYRHGYLHVA